MCGEYLYIYVLCARQLAHTPQRKTLIYERSRVLLLFFFYVGAVVIATI